MAQWPCFSKRSHLLPLCTYLLLFHNICCSSVDAFRINNQSNIRCISKERESLLEFKRGIQGDYCGLLASWGQDQRQQDCCAWEGVSCSTTRHGNRVTGLDLHGIKSKGGYQMCLKGKVSASLLELKYLKYLDLSFNDFQGEPIPSFIGSIISLEHLNLSSSGFHGDFPTQFGNLSKLASLRFDCSGVSCPIVKSLNWLSRLTLLRDIDLSGNDLSQVSNWFYIVNSLPNLKILSMDDCSLSPKMVPSLSFINSSSTVTFLSLAGNKFHGSSIFQWLFNLSGISTHLVHLDLSGNLVSGTIPNAFGKVYHLSYLDLSFNQLEGLIPTPFGNMIHLSYLDLSFNQLNGRIPSSIGSLQSLSHLFLTRNELECPIPQNISTLKSLRYLQLSDNSFQGSQCIPKTLGNSLCNLQELHLGNNSITDNLSSIIQSLTGCANRALMSLELSRNSIWGSIPDMISTFTLMGELSIDHNQLNGTIAEGIGQLSMLKMLDLSYNSLGGTLTSKHLSNLSRLSYLYLSNNAALEVNITADWIPSFQLDTLDVGSCKLGPYFPKWLQTQKNISWLDISNAGISDTIPAHFWNSLLYNLKYLNVSHNMIHGMLPHVSNSFEKLPNIDLSSNYIEGAIPSFLVNTTALFLNDNMFSEFMPFLCPKTETPLSFLDLSNNFLTGKLPDCWMNFNQLSVLHLDNNKFSGKLPASVGTLKQLRALHLRNNSLTSKLPALLFQKCKSLIILDLAYNSITGRVPIGIGNNLENLVALSLRNNEFDGVLPLNLCHLRKLQIIDLSGNHFSGSIPKCVDNLAAMRTAATDALKPGDNVFGYQYSPGYTDTLFVMWKRSEQVFRKTLGLVKAIDISDNELEGKIPDSITSLVGLVFLNLSRNNLSGSIPSKIGQLTSLQFLDLSNNHLSGEIPLNLSQVSFLEALDLSKNKLSGKIPTGTQLQGFDASAYRGNPGLCGPPLPKCSEDNIDQQVYQDEQGTDSIFPGLYIVVVLGFIVGLCGVSGTLAINMPWRDVVFNFFDIIRGALHDVRSKHTQSLEDSTENIIVDC